MGKIHVLGTEISNKIAAGEVVERPASVIKELVENSIDAGADVITVEIKKGGAVYMRVSDNGSGMSEDDAKICFLRHATSKITTSEDLDAIYTLGFRGEALSSIGAVAKVSLYTKRRSDMAGICVTCTGGEILSSYDAGTPDGTTVIVEDLFYNTPARLKFLKKDATEAGYITDAMVRFIFAHPEISFRLIIDGKEKLFSPGDNSLENAVYTVYKGDYAKEIIPVSYESDGIKVEGAAGKGTISRPNRNYQSFYVNRRYIKSPLIIRAVEEAYKNQVMIGKYPMAILNITIPPELVDINVHPTKLEVKFSNEKLVYQAVYYAVKNALYSEAAVPEVKLDTEFERDGSKEQLNLTDWAQSLKKKMGYNPHENHFMKSGGHNFHASERPTASNHYVAEPAYVSKNEEKVEMTPEERALVYGNESENVQKAAENEQKTAENAQKNTEIDEYFEVAGQVFDTYIIVEKGDDMLIIDQHAAHERLKYEELRRELAAKQIYSQMLFEPEVVNLTGAELGAYKENKDLIDGLGFETEEFGDNAVIVRSAPAGVEAGDIEPLIIELITQADNSKKELITEKNERLLYTIACKSAVKANRKMSTAEMETLVRNVLRLENINTCPHGRPIIIKMSKKELEKEFKRVL